MDDTKVRCVNCGEICRDTDIVYQVRIVDGEGNVTYAPACSQSCAKQTQDKYASIHRARLNDMDNQSFQKMTVINYLHQ